MIRLHTIRPLFLLPALVILLWHCRQKYVSPYKAPPSGYLVVEGFIAGNAPTQISLSRTLPLPGDTTIPAELGAVIRIESDHNVNYALPELGNGVYGVDSAHALNLAPTSKYRLRIQTTDGRQYLSDFVEYKRAPVIDSVNWTSDANGVQIYVNTHDPADTTRYYQWDYVQTWEHDAGMRSFWEYRYDSNPAVVELRAQDRRIDRCWTNAPSTDILLGTSEKLAQDVIYRFPLLLVPPNSIQTSVLYSISVRQYALTQDAYDFLKLIQKNSQSLGSIFDAQPSKTRGNIQCVNDPGQQVIGWVSAGAVQQQRIFISRDQVVSNYPYNCQTVDILVSLAPDSIKKYFTPSTEHIYYVPILEHFTNGFRDAWISNQAPCADCRLQGGSTQKPSFWPN
jgi:hypothetical protein